MVESSLTVGRNRSQVETGLAFEHSNDPALDQRTWSLPTLFRLGITANIEARLETDGYLCMKAEDKTDSTSNHGFADLSIGLKWHANDSEETNPWKPSLGWLVHADLPTGSALFKGKGVRPSLRMVAEWELPNNWSLGVMPGLVYENDLGNGRFVAGIFCAVLGKSVTDHLRGFVEVSGHQLARTKYGGNVVTLDVGGAYLARKDLQFDAAIFVGANKRTPDFAITVGISNKF